VVMTNCCWKRWTDVENGPRCTAPSVGVAAARLWAAARTEFL
jgi:hypothetical protein